MCIAAAMILAFQGFLRRPWRGPERDWVGILLIGAGIVGTLLVLFIPPLHTSTVGLLWTLMLLADLSITFYRSLIDRLGPRRTGVLLTLRLLAIALLVPMLFEPVVRFIARQKPERPVMLLVDASGSMSVPDVPNGPTRLQSIEDALRPQVPRLSQHFVPHLFSFATGAREIPSFNDLQQLKADGKSTDLVGAVRTALSKIERDDAIVILISDGVDNTSENVVGAIAAARRPINTVIVGSDQAESAQLMNVSVDDVSAYADLILGHQTPQQTTQQ